MYLDDSISDKNKLIKEIKVSKEYKPNAINFDLLMKRYSIWRDLYSSNKKNLLTA